MAHTIICITSYFKGNDFIREAKRQGCHVILLTEERLRDEHWARESIDQIFLMPNLSKLPDVLYAVSYLGRAHLIEAIIPLDEYDVEMAAILREHLQLEGKGISHTRYFRDKLTMRNQAHRAGINVPPFTSVINYDKLREYMAAVPPPYVLKPRLEAGAMGIKKCLNDEEVWRWLDQLGDEQSFRVLEQFIPGDVYHTDSIVIDGQVIFASVQKYGAPPMVVAHGGGIFITSTLPDDHADTLNIKRMNAEVIAALKMERGVTHAEFIKAHADAKLYFLEIAARVGGAHIADLVAAGSGVNLWAEWARIEAARLRGETYHLPELHRRHAALLLCLSKQEHPDLSPYTDPEVVWRLDMKQHAGLIVASDDFARVTDLVEAYHPRFIADFLAVAPPRDKPVH